MAELFWGWSHLNNISRVLEITFSYFSILEFLLNFRDFRVFVFGYRAQNENPEITEKFYFFIYQVQIHVDLFFDYYFSFLSVNTEINNKNKKHRLKLANLEELHSLERQKYDKQLTRWLNYFENDGIWKIFQEFLKFHSHISVFWGFLMNFRDFRVFIFGYRAQHENPEITKNFYFCVYKVSNTCGSVFRSLFQLSER